MKRLVALLMTACLVGTMLVGCGQKEEATSKSDVETKEETGRTHALQEKQNQKKLRVRRRLAET